MTELEVLAVVVARLGSLGIPYMLAGSFAMAFHAELRMTLEVLGTSKRWQDSGSGGC